MLDIVFVNQTEENLEALKTFSTALLNNAATYLKLAPETELSIIVVDNDAIQTINRDYREKDQVTDVITFALEDDETLILAPDMPRVLGDIFISIDRARSQAIDYGHSFEREFGFLLIHGLLHLLGYDHQNQTEEKAMFSLQEEILSANNLKKSE